MPKFESIPPVALRQGWRGHFKIAIGFGREADGHNRDLNGSGH